MALAYVKCTPYPKLFLFVELKLYFKVKSNEYLFLEGPDIYVQCQPLSNARK
jgi:hypothetical protein